MKTLFSLIVPTVPGFDSSPFEHAGPEPEQEFLAGAKATCSRPERPLPPCITGPGTPKAKHNTGARGSQVRATMGKCSVLGDWKGCTEK